MSTYSAKSQKKTLLTAWVCASGSSLVGCLDRCMRIVVARRIDLWAVFITSKKLLNKP